MERNGLKGITDDAINAVLATALSFQKRLAAAEEKLLAKIRAILDRLLSQWILGLMIDMKLALQTAFSDCNQMRSLLIGEMKKIV